LFNIARIWQSGFELNSTAADVEWTTITNASIQTSTVRTGVYALTTNGLVASTARGANFQFSASITNGPIFGRVYFRYSTLPDATTGIFGLVDGSLANGASTTMIKLQTNGSLILVYESSSIGVTQIGSASSVLAANTWYSLEIKFDGTGGAGATIIEGRLSNSVFATASNITVFGGDAPNSLSIGGNLDVSNDIATAGVFFFDDIAINDSTGANQTSYPGAGQIVHLQPNAAGDNNSFTVAVGGTAGAANNYTRVKEVTPDDATSYNGGVLNTDIDDFKMTATPSSIGSGDTINVVMVGVRYNAAVAASEASFKVRIKKVTGGTVSSSVAITPNQTAWSTNANAAPRNYPLITYQNPDAAAWTKALLDTAQVGYNISTTNTNAADISTVWVSVDSTPVVASTGGPAGIGKWLEGGIKGPENFF